MAKRSAELDKAFAAYGSGLGSFFADMKPTHATLLTFDLTGASPDEYNSISSAILEAFTEEFARRILTTTWLFLDPANEYLVRNELRGILPQNSRWFITKFQIDSAHYAGFD